MMALSRQKNGINVDQKINQLIQYGKGQLQSFDYSIIPQVCDLAKKTLLEQSQLLQLFAPIKVVGSLFGHFRGLLHIFDFIGWPKSMSYIFLGNYVDKGPQSLQTILLLFLFKIKYPTTFFMLRGRHEYSYMNVLNGFYNQCKEKCNEQMWRKICQVYQYLPYAAVVDQKIFLVSGGIGPQLQDLRQIQKIERGLQIPGEGLACDLIWSDPDKYNYGFEKNIQGISLTFGRDCLQRFLVLTGTEILIRSRQVLQEGFQFFFQKKLVCLFSAPNFLNKFNNCAGILSIGNDLSIDIQIFIPKKIPVVVPDLFFY